MDMPADDRCCALLVPPGETGPDPPAELRYLKVRRPGGIAKRNIDPARLNGGGRVKE